MSRRLSKKAEKVIKKVMEEERLFEHPLALVAKAGARMMLQVALEEEITTYLGRDYYERNDDASGYRSGSKRRTVKLSCGDIEIDMPQARGLPFHSAILPPYQTRMKELEEVIPLLYMNGLSTRRVKRSLKKVLGKRGLSHTTVNKITNKVIEEFKGWRRRDLSGLEVIYLILDGIRIGVRGGTGEKEAVLVAYAFLGDGRREVLSVELGNRESYNSWKYILDDLRQKGLIDPLLIVTDGCPGLLKAVEDVFPGVETQRCTKHRMENVIEKVLKEDHEEVRDDLRKIFYAPTYEHAKEAVVIFEKKWGKKYPSAIKCLSEGIENCLTYYKFPYSHWKRIRTTNTIERGFREVRQRVRVIGRFKDEEKALATVWWLMKDTQERWQGIVITKEIREILNRLRKPAVEKMAA